MKIYTKTGDLGKTSLLGGTRVSKDDLRIHAYGTVDELNSYIGLVRDQEVNEKRKDILKEIQDRLFTVGSTLAADPNKTSIKKPDLHQEDIQLLEKEIDLMESELPELKSFILPGGHTSVSFCHLARCVCRRAERYVVGLAETAEIDPLVIMYLNRLSDFLFVLARKMGAELQVSEITWNPRSKK
jgi:cob(I)alamin adenosyltransferase